MTPHSRVIDPLLQSALIVRIGLCAAPESKLLAKVVSTLAADATLAASDANLESHSVAELEASDLRANGDYLARRLMA